MAWLNSMASFHGPAQGNGAADQRAQNSSKRMA